MPEWPETGSFVPEVLDNPEAGAALEAWLATSKQLLGAVPKSTYVIAGNSVTPAVGRFRVDAPAGSSAGALYRLQLSLPDGWLVGVSIQDAAKPITFKHGAGGNGQLLLHDAADLVLGSTSAIVFFERDASLWRELFRWYGDAKAAARLNLGLGAAALLIKATSANAIEGLIDTAAVTPKALGDAFGGADLVVGRRLATTVRQVTDEIVVKRTVEGQAILLRMSLLNLLDGPEPFVSGELTIGDSVDASFEHGLGSTPRRVEAWLRCKTADQGYEPGMEIRLDAMTDSGEVRAITIWRSPTHVGYACIDHDDPVAAVPRGGGSGKLLDPDFWRLVITAWK